MKFKPRHTFLLLSSLFLLYSFSIYLHPLRVADDNRYDKELASEGRLVWQKYNCQSCHQFYGLGGYLGPDLTNFMSKPGRGEPFLKAMVNSGIKQMPAFSLTDVEIHELAEFLKATDASGSADPRSFKANNFGMIEHNEHEKN
ncbi:MAG: cytochrome c [Bacteroidetes bacterium]|jgi:nitric oxide reductase subunit C|nr:cytochrome c [Bacteroidota bacterium]